MENIKIGDRVFFINNAGERIEGVVSYIDSKTYPILFASIELSNSMEVFRSVGNLSLC